MSARPVTLSCTACPGGRVVTVDDPDRVPGTVAKLIYCLDCAAIFGRYIAQRSPLIIKTGLPMMGIG